MSVKRRPMLLPSLHEQRNYLGNACTIFPRTSRAPTPSLGCKQSISFHSAASTLVYNAPGLDGLMLYVAEFYWTLLVYPNGIISFHLKISFSCFLFYQINLFFLPVIVSLVICMFSLFLYLLSLVYILSIPLSPLLLSTYQIYFPLFLKILISFPYPFHLEWLSAPRSLPDSL